MFSPVMDFTLAIVAMGYGLFRLGRGKVIGLPFLVIGAVLFVIALGKANAQQCPSSWAASFGGWQAASSAPRDGTVVEMLETFGIAPWRGIFKWSGDSGVIDPTTGKDYQVAPAWRDANSPDLSVHGDVCLFWRPYKPTGKKYVDPTGGAQNTVAYWCAAMRRPYDKKTDRCK